MGGKDSRGTGEISAAIVAACEKKNGTWDDQRRECRPIRRMAKEPVREISAAIVAACEKRGGVWDAQNRQCEDDDDRPRRKNRRDRDDNDDDCVRVGPAYVCKR
jgi:hypothetical protein